MAEFMSMHEADDKFAKKGTGNAALALGIVGTALGAGLLNGGGILGGLFGGNNPIAQQGANYPYLYNESLDPHVTKDLFWRQNVELEKEFGKQRYDNLKANYDLYITLDNKISSLATKDAQLEAALPLMFKLAKVEAERYSDKCCCETNAHIERNMSIVERQLANKIDGDVKLPWTAIYTGIPTMPACAFDVTCGKHA